MPYYLIETTLPHAHTSAALDLRGIYVMVRRARRTRQGAELLRQARLDDDARRRRALAPFFLPERTHVIAELPNKQAAVAFGEAEAYRQLGRSRPATLHYFALHLRSVERNRDAVGEVLDKQIMVVAGPCRSVAALIDTCEVSPAGAQFKRTENAYRAWLASGSRDPLVWMDLDEEWNAYCARGKANWPDDNRFHNKPWAIVRAAHKQDAIDGFGLAVPSLTPQVVAALQQRAQYES